MRGRIALPKHFVQNSSRSLFGSRSFWSAGASSRRFSELYLRLCRFIWHCFRSPESFRKQEADPTWMWRNTVVVELVEWLRGFNKNIDPKRAPVDLRGVGQIGVLQQRRIERAIGVIYQAKSERLSHYFHARLPEQFDAVIHFDETHAVEPLEYTSLWEEGELPETYPFKV